MGKKKYNFLQLFTTISEYSLDLIQLFIIYPPYKEIFIAYLLKAKELDLQKSIKLVKNSDDKSLDKTRIDSIISYIEREKKDDVRKYLSKLFYQKPLFELIKHTINRGDKIDKQIHGLFEAIREIEIKIVKENNKLVSFVAGKYKNDKISQEDLIQEGQIGLIKAISKFNPKLGYQFSTYATWWIRQMITSAISSQGRVIRLPHYVLDSVIKIDKFVCQYHNSHNNMPEDEEILNNIKASKFILENRKVLFEDAASLDQMNKDNRNKYDVLESPNNKEEEKSEQIKKALSSLSILGQKIIRLKIGLTEDPFSIKKEILSTSSTF